MTANQADERTPEQRRADHVAALVAKARPLSRERRARLAVLLRPVGDLSESSRGEAA